MTILTSKMKTAREALELGSNCKFWIAGDAAGTTIVDKVQGLTATDASATHDVPHAITAVTSGEMTGQGTLTIPRYGVVLAVQLCSTSFALTNVTIGSVTPNIFIGGSGVAITLPSGTTSGTMAGTLTAGQLHCAATSWDATNLYTYEGIAADASLIDTDALTEVVKAELAANIVLSNTLSLNSAIRSSLYGLVIFGFDEPKTSAEVITAINWMKNRWIVGHYELYPDWK